MTMRKLGAILIAAMVLTWVTLAAIPARAETLVDVQSFVNSSGNTVTVTDTYEINGTDVVLISRTVTEVQPDGFVKLEKSWTFYSSGAVQTSEELRYSSISTTDVYREYSESGVVLFQRSELTLNGELALVSLNTFNADGYLVSKEDRQLITLADGTQVWEVTVTSYNLDGTVSSETVTQYPYGYDFDAPPAGEEPGDDPEEPTNMRPGWGYGDDNHEHSGPPGHEVSASSGGNGNGGANGNSNDTERPGHGWGDDNHSHTGNGK
ncbi:MAG: hypothetical protein Q8R78_02980 [Candidatus Omnitrophota bacterium]|nr:hypothetical protein [Candidatus Omnitrophota bacterium]